MISLDIGQDLVDQDFVYEAPTISSFVQFLPETCYIPAHVQMLRYLLTYLQDLVYQDLVDQEDLVGQVIKIS